MKGASNDEPPLLLDCLHPSVFSSSSEHQNSAETTAAQRCFCILLKLLSNHRQHPSDPLYASFSAVSNAWRSVVLPCVYVLRLTAWMGCVPNAEGSRYVFTPSTSGKEEKEWLHQIDSRIEELRCVMAVWVTPLACIKHSPNFAEEKGDLQSPAQRGSGCVAESIDDLALCLADGRAALIALYAQATLRSSAVRTEACDVCTRALQLQLLRKAHDALDDDTANSFTGGSAASSVNKQVLPPWLTRVSADVEACEAAIAANASLQRLVAHVSLCELTQECECAATAAAATSSSSHPLSSSTALPADAASSTADTAVKATLSVSSTLAKRFRQQASEEQQRRYLATTGPAYRQLSHEARHRGESIVIDIAGLLEQIAVVTERQGMVRTDRQEARRLLEEFKQDGDLVKLYALQEQYAAELEEAKAQYGKPLVYAEYK